MTMLTGTWEKVLRPEFKKPYYRELYEKVRKAYQTQTVYPPSDNIFEAFHLTPFEKVKVVILGQDPYHEPGEAEGLAFSVPEGTPVPPSLQNIYKEMADDIGAPLRKTGSLRHWAEEGVLLLNSILTVEAHHAFSHASFGWEEFTDEVLRILNKENRPMVFILWGNSAIRKKAFLTNPNHLVLTSPHPSPLSAYRGFFGSKPFSKTNAFLESHGETPIRWVAK